MSKVTIWFSIVVIIGFIPNGCQSFLVSNSNTAIPILAPEEHSNGITLNIGFDIPSNLKDETSSRLYINDFVVELKNMKVSEDHATLPEPTRKMKPISRTGPLGLETQSPGRFVSIYGEQLVNFQDGCWEVAWKEGNLHGSLLCAFSLEKQISRNDATLHAGEVYVAFPIFSKQGLDTLRLKKNNYETLFKSHKDKQDNELEVVNNTNNLLKKAIHFRRAVAANEKASMMRTHAYEHIPRNDEDIIAISDDFVIHSKGVVMSKSKESTYSKVVYVGKVCAKQL